jgi:hypothetical protein
LSKSFTSFATTFAAFSSVLCTKYTILISGRMSQLQSQIESMRIKPAFANLLLSHVYLAFLDLLVMKYKLFTSGQDLNAAELGPDLYADAKWVSLDGNTVGYTHASQSRFVRFRV